MFGSDLLRYLDYESLKPHFRSVKVLGEAGRIMVFSRPLRSPSINKFPSDTSITITLDAHGRLSELQKSHGGPPTHLTVQWTGDIPTTISMWSLYRDGRRRHKFVFQTESAEPYNLEEMGDPIAWPVGTLITDARFGEPAIHYRDSPAMTDEEILKLAQSYQRRYLSVTNSLERIPSFRWLGWGGAGLIVLAFVLRARRRRRSAV